LDDRDDKYVPWTPMGRNTVSAARRTLASDTELEIASPLVPERAIERLPRNRLAGSRAVPRRITAAKRCSGQAGALLIASPATEA